MARDYFVLHTGYWAPISRMSNEQLGRLFRAIYTYHTEGVEDVDADIEMAFGFFLNQFKYDEMKYNDLVEKRTRASRSRSSHQMISNDVKCDQMISDDINKEKKIKEDKIKENKCVCVNNAAGASAHTYTDTDIYLEIFFFRNVKKAEAETRRFVAYYESTNWTLSGGQYIDGENRASRAVIWDVPDKSPRFPLYFLKAWRTAYESMPDAIKMDALRDSTSARLDGAKFVIRCEPSIRTWIFSDEGRVVCDRAFEPITSKYKLIIQ